MLLRSGSAGFDDFSIFWISLTPIAAVSFDANCGPPKDAISNGGLTDRRRVLRFPLASESLHLGLHFDGNTTDSTW